MWLRTVAGTVGLAAILACGWLINGVRKFPGPWALVPVGATMLLIAAGANRGARPSTRDRMPFPTGCWRQLLVTLGSMAYSLYLWHWPLLIFWLAYTGEAHAGFLDGLVLLLVSAGLAYLTMRFIEEPLRGARCRSAARGGRPGGKPAQLAAPAGGRRDRGDPAGCGADRDFVRLARARRGAARQRRNSPACPPPAINARALLDDARVPQLNVSAHRAG